jgi:hypothetical protein
MPDGRGAGVRTGGRRGIRSGRGVDGDEWVWVSRRRAHGGEREGIERGMKKVSEYECYGRSRDWPWETQGKSGRGPRSGSQISERFQGV